MSNMLRAQIHFLVTTIVLFAGTLLSGCVDARDHARGELQSHLANVREALPRWYAGGYIDSLATLYDSESVLFPSGSAPIEGADAIVAHWRDAFTAVHWDVRMKTQDLNISPPIAVERGVFQRRALLKVSNETVLADSGQYVLTWHYGLRGWRVQYEVVLRVLSNGE